MHKNIIYSINNRIQEYRFLILKRFFYFFSKNDFKNVDDLFICKNKILTCLLGCENDMFPCLHNDKRSSCRGSSRCTGSGSGRNNDSSRRIKRKKGKNNKNYYFYHCNNWGKKEQGSTTQLTDIFKEKTNKLTNGCIFISKNVVCVDPNVAFWQKRKNKKIFHLHFKPFQNYFSSLFYQKYLHVFLYFSKIGTLVRYIKMFTCVFTKIMYRKVEAPGALSSGAHIRSIRCSDQTSKDTDGKKHKQVNQHYAYSDEDVVPVGEVFISYVHSVRKYMLLYEDKIRKIFLDEHIGSPLEIYNKIKKYTECIEFLSFLCSSYTYDDEIFYKKYYAFYKNSNNFKKNNPVITKGKQIHEYNYFSNIIYGLSHEHYEGRHMQKGKKRRSFAELETNEVVHNKIISKRPSVENDINKNNSNNKSSNSNSNSKSKSSNSNNNIALLKNGLDLRNYNLFIFPRGSELLSYIYKYYYLFLNTNKKNLMKLCRFIFLRIIKPFLHFLYSYVYMGINKDYHFEYIINKHVVNKFFFIYQNRTKYYDRKYLLSSSCISLPIFLKYSIEVIYSSGKSIYACTSQAQRCADRCKEVQTGVCEYGWATELPIC